MLSSAPHTTSSAIDSGNDVDSPNPTVARPNSATTISSTRPGRCHGRSRPPITPIATAPTDWAARNMP